jgi:DNA-binding MarR family transcriptional regulator
MLPAWTSSPRDQPRLRYRATRWTISWPPGIPSGRTSTWSPCHLDRARRVAFTDHGLELWEFDVLSALRRQGAPYQLTPGALLRATLVTSGTMTNRVDQLAKAGLVRREPDPQDRRGVLVTLTPAGVDRVDAALADLLRSEHALLGGLSESDRRTLADLLRVLLAPLDA